MADILSLSKARKSRARVLKDAQSAENRVKFGRTKAEKQRQSTELDRAARKAEAHKRDD